MVGFTINGEDGRKPIKITKVPKSEKSEILPMQTVCRCNNCSFDVVSYDKGEYYDYFVVCRRCKIPHYIGEIYK